jgi:hypothetical protein
MTESVINIAFRIVFHSILDFFEEKIFNAILFIYFRGYYSLSSKGMVDINITKFYAEKVLPSVNYLFIYLQAVTFFALKLCSN